MKDIGYVVYQPMRRVNNNLKDKQRFRWNSEGALTCLPTVLILLACAEGFHSVPGCMIGGQVSPDPLHEQLAFGRVASETQFSPSVPTSRAAWAGFSVSLLSFLTCMM